MDDLIYNQHALPKEEFRYGLRSSADTGCGWIATYNALRLMGYRTNIRELIRYYEWQLPLIHGNAGTSFWSPAVCFQHWGFPVRVVTDRKRYDEAAKASDVCIVFYYWRKKWKIGAHFVTVQYRDGRFVGYNTYNNSKGPDDWSDSIDGFLKQKKYFGTVLICINDKRKKAE